VPVRTRRGRAGPRRRVGLGVRPPAARSVCPLLPASACKFNNFGAPGEHRLCFSASFFRHEPEASAAMFLLDWLTSLLRLLGLSSKKARIVILGAFSPALRRASGCLPRARCCTDFQATITDAIPASTGRALGCPVCRRGEVPACSWDSTCPFILTRCTVVFVGLQVWTMRANLRCCTSSAATRFEPSCPLQRLTPKHFRSAASLSQRGTSVVTNRCAAVTRRACVCHRRLSLHLGVGRPVVPGAGFMGGVLHGRRCHCFHGG